MINVIRAMLEKYKNILIYIFFGVITTAVNYLVYLPLYNYFSLPAAICNIIAWLIAVAVAFLTNKPFVFHSHDWSLKTVVSELTAFYSLRALSGVVETLIVFLAVDILRGNGNVWKLLTSLLVIVLNYIFSKFIVFRNNKKAPG